MNAIAWVLWDGTLGGTESLAGELVGEAVHQGHDVSILFLGDSGPLEARLQRRSVPFHALESWAGTGRAVLARRRLAAELTRYAATGVVLPTTGILPLVIRAGGYQGTIVAVEHGGLLARHELPAAMRFTKRCVRRLGRRAIDVEVGVSRYMLERLRDGDEAAETVCIANGVDTRRFSPDPAGQRPDDPVIFGWAGRMISGKGLDVLLHAASLIGGRSFEIRLAGDGPVRRQLQRLVGRLGVGKQVVFEGRVDDMPAFWRGCHVAVSPADSFVESFGIAPAEASAVGLPVIATDLGALPEVVEHGQTGTVVAPGDPAGLKSAMETYLRSPELRARHGNAGRERAQRLYSLERCLQQYLRLFPA